MMMMTVYMYGHIEILIVGRRSRLVEEQDEPPKIDRNDDWIQ